VRFWCFCSLNFIGNFIFSPFVFILLICVEVYVGFRALIVLHVTFYVLWIEPMLSHCYLLPMFSSYFFSSIIMEPNAVPPNDNRHSSMRCVFSLFYDFHLFMFYDFHHTGSWCVDDMLPFYIDFLSFSLFFLFNETDSFHCWSFDNVSDAVGYVSPTFGTSTPIWGAHSSTIIIPLKFLHLCFFL
jgi:hypothetical protein